MIYCLPGTSASRPAGTTEPVLLAQSFAYIHGEFTWWRTGQRQTQPLCTRLEQWPMQAGQQAIAHRMPFDNGFTPW